MIKFKKQANGNVLVLDKSDDVIASLNAQLNVLKSPNKDVAVVTDDSSPHENLVGFQFSLAGTDLANCDPVIQASTLGELIKALSSSFFFRRKLVLPTELESKLSKAEEVLFEEEFSNNENKTLFSGVDFDITYFGSNKSIQINNKGGGWFNVDAICRKGTTSNSICSDVGSGNQPYFISDNGSFNANFALDAPYSSSLSFVVGKESIAGKEQVQVYLFRKGVIIKAKVKK